MNDEQKFEILRILTKPMRITLFVIGLLFLLIFIAITNQHEYRVPNMIYIIALVIPFIIFFYVFLAKKFDKGELKENVRKDIIKKHKEQYARELKNRTRNRA